MFKEMFTQALKLLVLSEKSDFPLIRSSNILKDFQTSQNCENIENKIKLCQNQLLYFKMRVILVGLYYLD